MDKEYIIAEIQRVASELGTETVSRSTFKSKSNVSEWHILKNFDSWNEAVIEAGLTPTITSRIDEDSLFIEMRRVFIQYGGICTLTKFDKLCRYSVYVYRKRFGKWNNVLLAFREWVEDSEEPFPLIDQLPLPTSPHLVVSEKSNSQLAQKEIFDTTQGTMFGPFLNFRGLQHEPINEQGVVFLFGMVCFELGIVVESIRTGYPDCEAKRKVRGKRGKWQRVRIEFEYRSSEFRNHGHNPEGCDIIVCWIHDWDDTPLEVIELRTAIKELEE